MMGRVWTRTSPEVRRTRCRVLLTGLLIAVLHLAVVEDSCAFQKWPIKQFKVHFGARSDWIETPDVFSGFSEQQVDDIELLLNRTARKLEDMGFQPPRIANTTTLDDGSEAYLVYLYEYDGAPARYLVACEGEDVEPRIDLNAKNFLDDGRIADKAFSDTIHELVHAAQRATELYKNECNPGSWIGEGTAEAVGHDIARELRGSSVEERGTNKALMRWGGRDYTERLWVLDTSTSESKDLAYQTSSLWRYLAELTEAGMTGGPKPGSPFHETDYSYLPRILSRTTSGSGEKAELEWLHTALKSDPAIGVGLDVVYPDFVSVLAGYGRRIDTSLPEEEARKRWLSVVFNGCHMVGLSPTAPETQISVSMGLITADCIDIRISGKRGSVPVHVEAVHKSPRLVEQLSAARLGDNEAERAKVTSGGTGTASAAWDFSLDAPGPSYLVISNVAKDQPQNTQDVTVDLKVSLGPQAGSTLRSTYESLLPPMPEALRQATLAEFDKKTPVAQKKLIDKVRNK